VNVVVASRVLDSESAAPHFAQIVSEVESDAPHRGHVTDSVTRDVTALAGRAGVSDTIGPVSVRLSK
jgi:hypothetical protein